MVYREITIPKCPWKKLYKEDAPSYEKEAEWFKKQLDRYGDCMVISALEGDFELYSLLEEDLLDARYFIAYSPRIDVAAGPIIRIPYVKGLERDQKKREELNPLMRLAKQDAIRLYPLEKRMKQRFTLVENLENSIVFQPYGLGEKPQEVERTENTLFGTGLLKLDFLRATWGKREVYKDFSEHLVFLTDGEIEALKEWAKQRRKDIKNIDIETAREFWMEYDSAMRRKEMEKWRGDF